MCEHTYWEEPSVMMPYEKLVHILDEFPKLLSKYRANYNWYKDYNHYIDDIDYEELGG